MFAGVAYLRRHQSSSAAVIFSHPRAYPLTTDIAFFGQECVLSWKPGLACWCDVDRLALGESRNVSPAPGHSPHLPNCQAPEPESTRWVGWWH